MQELASHFIPAADEVWRLQHRDGPECDLFRLIAEQGHYAGRTTPTDTRQGIYALTPDGQLLASVNTTSADRMVRMLRKALDAWKQLQGDGAVSDDDKATTAHGDAPLRRRAETRYSEDGLILRVSSRDLPREHGPQQLPGNPRPPGIRRGGNDDIPKPDVRRHHWGWNLDYCWFTEDEMRALVPNAGAVGATRRVPSHLVRRLARLHLVDNVRGQVRHFDDDHVIDAELVATIVSRTGTSLSIEFQGQTRTRVKAQPDKLDPEGWQNPEFMERGVRTDLMGRAVYDTQTKRFVTFELVALGTRWGGTRYNNRERDLEPNGIGFLFTLADDDLPVAPATLWKYGW